MCSRLNDSDKNFVPFIAIYSTPTHPLGLVFKFMERLNLGDYLRNNPDIPRLELVRPCRHTFALPHRLGISCWKSLAA